MRKPWPVLVALLGVIILGTLWKGQAARSTPVLGSQDKNPASSEIKALFHGAGSCSARGCHGGIEPVPHSENLLVRQDEYTRWTLQDPHTRAFAVLWNERSQNIVRNLAGGKGHVPAPQDPRCLACHVLPASAPSIDHFLIHQEGVGCEACHGNSGKWLEPHTTPAWKDFSLDKKKNEYGFENMGSLENRIQVCAGCHVGAPAEGTNPLRDMNHDFIAAGHPRLNFEFSTYFAHLPPHWNPQANLKPPSEAQLWAIGQIETARAALKLLEDRARDEKRPWPEFAEYDCFACHHDLNAKSWRQTRGYKGLPGAIPFGTWYFSMPGRLADMEGAKDLAGHLQALEIEMAKPGPDRKKIAESLATVVRDHLISLRTRAAGWDHQGLQKLLSAKESPWSWDEAEQLFLAVCALNQEKNVDRKKLVDLSKERAFPGNFDSPRTFAPANFLDLFREVQKELK